jgi:hypothetical protein
LRKNIIARSAQKFGEKKSGQFQGPSQTNGFTSFAFSTDQASFGKVRPIPEQTNGFISFACSTEQACLGNKTRALSCFQMSKVSCKKRSLIMCQF